MLLFIDSMSYVTIHDGVVCSLETTQQGGEK